jgi:hypothetical protein
MNMCPKCGRAMNERIHASKPAGMAKLKGEDYEKVWKGKTFKKMFCENVCTRSGCNFIYWSVVYYEQKKK